MLKRPARAPAVLLTLGLLAFPTLAAAADTGISRALAAKAVELERRLGARLGVAIVDTGSGETASHRSDERFPLNSTFKAFACAGLLARVDAGEESPERTVEFAQKDLVTYSPVTEKRVGGAGMTLAELCEAATATSDNTAANLVLHAIGGPQALTAFMRSVGDGETRLDRREPDLNEAAPGDPRDTTTPAAAAESLRKLVLGTALSQPSRRRLTEWLVGNTVGGPLLRASLPDGWRIADRTGAGGFGSRSVVAVVWPPDRAPLVAAVYLTGTAASMTDRNRAIAEIGELIVETVGRQ